MPRRFVYTDLNVTSFSLHLSFTRFSESRELAIQIAHEKHEEKRSARNFLPFFLIIVYFNENNLLKFRNYIILIITRLQIFNVMFN